MMARLKYHSSQGGDESPHSMLGGLNDDQGPDDPLEKSLKKKKESFIKLIL